MTCKCTYIAGKNVLPKNSLLYCKFLLRLPYNKILSIYTLIIMTLLFSGNYLPRVSNNVLYKTLVV